MTSPSFNDLLVRADEVLLQSLLGRPALRLLQSLLGRDLNVGRLREVLLQLHSPLSILLMEAKRNEVLDLLNPTEAAYLAAELDLTETSPYAALHKVPTRVSSPTFRQMLAALGVDDQQGLPKAETAPDEIQVTPAYALFSHQRAAARQAFVELGHGQRRVLLHMPTGAGKTRTANAFGGTVSEVRRTFRRDLACYKRRTVRTSRSGV